ncbi:hypothetical protein B0H66DRAFT_619055 [Apodospora peruviana]|uniref:GPI inositol-deacylase n=1 Tax=Apodospora peruviana TaxID=516989 RepID=A0AAE0M7I1_9PEZI|nr:hypothetical protein B0H66DRAFT_619055 [Apodospora peruviana]
MESGADSGSEPKLKTKSNPLVRASKGETFRSGFSSLERRLRRLNTGGSTPSSTSSFVASRGSRDDPRGPDGLNLLSEPSEAHVDLVFVHGLRGGSRKTWSYSEDPSHYWPKEWLPAEPGFKNVRIHSYGYNSDWAAKKGNVLDVYDFGKSLLAHLHTSLGTDRDEKTPLVLVGHSMGGLVIKKAFLLAERDPNYTQLVSRIKAMVFLATPHRGAESAQLLSNILTAAVGNKGYVQDLIPNSGLLLATNDEFRHVYQDVQLWSFYETIKTRIGYKEDLVVPRESAVMGLPGERTQPLQADHRYVCKYSTPRDPNYIAVRNALLTILRGIEQEWSVLKRDESRSQMKSISHYISAPARPEDELSYKNDLQIEGSCLWLLDRPSFQDWQESGDDDAPNSPHHTSPKVFWLTGRPGTGKSVMSGHIINYLVKSRNADCSYYFFKHNNKADSSIVALLRSLSYQMAETNPSIRQELLSMVEDGEYFNKDDERAVWKALFLLRIFRLTLPRTHYWVIDALDECPNYAALFPLLARIDQLFPLKIFITSRPLPTQKSCLAVGTEKKLDVVVESIQEEDTIQDIRLFLQSRADVLPVEDEDARNDLIEKILQKSNGSFLWASLVANELAMTHSEQQVTDVLSQVPSEMDDVYTRILNGLQSPRNQSLAKAIFRWTICAARPLSVGELKEALMLDTGHVVPRLETVIGRITGSLVDVGTDSKVQVVHETVKAFLTRKGLVSEYAVERRKEHSRLAEVCLGYLCGDELQHSSRRESGARASVSLKTSLDNTQTSAFSGYALTYFSHHLAESSSTIDLPLTLLDKFFRTTVLGWIELVARAGDLGVMLQTSRNLKTYLNRRAKYRSPLGQEVQRADGWSDDLIRVVAAFGRNIVSLPESVHSLVPALCPPKSMVHRGFGKDAAKCRLEVVGCSDDDWDERISCMVYPDGQALCVASWESRFAVGLSTGKIMVYKTTTFEAIRTLNHGEQVRNISFTTSGSDDLLLASCGRKTLVLWDPGTGTQLWSTKLGKDDHVLGMSFGKDGSLVMLATSSTRGNAMVQFDTRTGARLEPWSFFDMDEEVAEGTANMNMITKRPPTHVALSSETNLLGVAYMQRPISFWDLEDNSWLSHFHKGDPKVYPRPLLLALTINPNLNLELAAAAYQDGDLVVFNPFDGLQVASIETYAHVLVSSPDGRTLATGDGNGMIQLYTFETLRLLYRVSMYDYDIRNMAFTSDSLRFFDIRGNQCNSWEPTVLVRNRDSENETMRSSGPNIDEVPHPALLVDGRSVSSERAITAICEHASGDWIFGGRENGSVAVFDIWTGRETQELVAPMAIAVKLLAWSAATDRLATVHTASCITVRKATLNDEAMWTVENPSLSIRAGRPVQQVLFDPSGRILLVSTDEVDEMWDVQEAKKIGAGHPRAGGPGSSWRWVNHPVSEGNLALVESGCVHIYDWAGFSRLSKLEGIKLSGSTSDVTLDHSIASNGGPYLCIRFLRPSAADSSKNNSSLPELQVYLGSELLADALEVRPIAWYRELTSQIKTVIGMYKSSLLVFLDVDGWICSLKIMELSSAAAVIPGPASYYIRHFFIPFSWYNVGDMNMFLTVTAGGSVALARRDEVIILHHGLDFFNHHKIPLDVVKNAGDHAFSRGTESVAGGNTAGFNNKVVQNSDVVGGAKISRRRRPGLRAVGGQAAGRSIRSDAEQKI